MDLQTFIENSVKAARQNRLNESDQLTLGEMILKLEPIVEKQSERDEEAKIQFDFEYFFPTDINSWRGSYDELALNIKNYEYGKKGPMTVSDFLKLLKDTVGKTFQGYKGGYFKMSKNTPVWVANYGNSGNTAVIDIVDDGWQVLIMTGYREY